MAEISNNGAITKSETGRSEDELPNIMFVQLESFFDPTEVEWLRFSEDPIPNLRKLFNEYSTGYFKVPSVGAGTANTEFEVLTGMSMRFFGPGNIRIRLMPRQRYWRVLQRLLRAWVTERRRFTTTEETSTAARRYSITWDSITIRVKSS